jgi:hypothetical protein
MKSITQDYQNDKKVSSAILLNTIISSETISKLTYEKRVNVLILDDTSFERTSAKRVELQL